MLANFVRTSTTVIATFAITVSAALGTPNTEQYQLAAACSRDAARVFKENDGKIGLVDGTSTNFQNHYNARTNKCFMVVTQISFPNAGKAETAKPAPDGSVEHESKTKDLVDVNENNIVGEFVQLIWPASGDARTLSCYVFGSACRTEAEWDALAEPFMKN